MKYRIKIIKFKSGRKEYIAQVKMRIGWGTLDYNGNVVFLYDIKLTYRKTALERIDKHFEGNDKKQTIEFEFINK